MRQGSKERREAGRGEGRITVKAIEVRPLRGGLPQGRRAGAKRPNMLLVAVILSQSVSGGHGRSIGGERREDPNGVRLPRANCPICAILATSKPRAVPQAPATGCGRWSGAAIPSLGAHKPNPAGRDPSGPSRRNT